MYYVIPDIHGQYTDLKRITDRIFKDKEPNDIVIFLGDYIDKGLESDEVINYLHSIKDRPDVILLLGNHDYYFYQSIKEVNNFDLFAMKYLAENSIETLESYGLDCEEIKYISEDTFLNLKTKLDFKRRFNTIFKEIYDFKYSDDFKKFEEVINACSLYEEDDRFVFSHSGGTSSKPTHKQSISDWISSRDFRDRVHSDKYFVVGHTPNGKKNTMVREGQIWFCDTGSVFDDNKTLPVFTLPSD